MKPWFLPSNIGLSCKCSHHLPSSNSMNKNINVHAHNCTIYWDPILSPEHRVNSKREVERKLPGETSLGQRSHEENTSVDRLMVRIIWVIYGVNIGGFIGDCYTHCFFGGDYELTQHRNMHKPTSTMGWGIWMGRGIVHGSTEESQWKWAGKTPEIF